MHSVFTCKQWETNTNKKPTSPYTAPAVLGHLVTTSLAKSRGECLSCQSRVLRGGEEGGNPIPYTHPQGRRAAKEYSTPPRHSRPSLTPATGLSPSHITEGKRFQMDGARRLELTHSPIVEEGLLQLLTHLSQLALLSGSVAQWLSGSAKHIPS